MDREFCIAYILDDCEDCPECAENRECQTESHCFEVKQKIIADLRKLDKIEQIVNEVKIDKIITKALAFNKIKEVLDKE